MIPLDTDRPPTTLADWRAALADTLARWFAGPARSDVTGEPPALTTVAVDLTGTRFSDAPQPDVTIVGPTDPGPTVDRLQIVARPVVVRDVPVTVDASANRVRFALGRTAVGQLVVTIAGIDDGRVTVHLSPAAVDAALLAAARSAAAAHGVDVRAVHATLTARSPRAVDVAMDVTVKKFVTIPLRLAGRVTIDDAMVATATGLTVDGPGMAGHAAAAVLRPQLAKADGRPIPLPAPPGVAVRDVAIDVADGVRVTVTVGPA